MTTVDDAVEAGARALDSSYNPDQHPIMAAMFEDYSLAAARAMWPILSAGLRRLHSPQWECGNPRHTNPDVGCPECCEVCVTCEWCAMPCATVQELDRIDKELGL